MKKNTYIVIIHTALIYMLSSCISAYEAADVEDMSGLLVVEGVILEEGTQITLSRTVRLNESLTGYIFEGVNFATIHIIDEAYNVVAVAEQEGTWGPYIVKEKFSFVPGMKYALDIDVYWKHYQSAFVEPVSTPAIDSVNWTLNDDNSIDITVSTHDPNNETLYSLWEYEENWELRATRFGSVRFDPITQTVIQQSLTGDNRYYCWASDRSKSLLLSSSDKFSNAIIKDYKIHTLYPGNHRYSYLYSINVSQYRLSREASEYFNNLQRNIEDGGSLFAPQPSEITGNIRCLSDPDETTIGYIFASKAATSRIFIPMEELRLNRYEGLPDCSDLEQPFGNPAEAYRAGYGVWGTDGHEGFIYASFRCVDCTERTDARFPTPSKNKPVFWPNEHQ